MSHHRAVCVACDACSALYLYARDVVLHESGEPVTSDIGDAVNLTFLAISTNPDRRRRDGRI
jgi:hypothetical protein